MFLLIILIHDTYTCQYKSLCINSNRIIQKERLLYKMTEAFTAGVMIFIEQFWARWPWSIVSWNPDYRCRRLLPKSRRLPFSGFLSLDVPSPAVGDILRSGRCRCACCRGYQYAASLCGCLPQPGTKRRGKRILRMEDAGTSEEDDDIDSQASNTPIDHGHLARNCSIKIITL